MNKKKLATTAATLTVALALGAAGIAVARTVATDSTRSYCAEMPDAVGLYAGNPVTQMGFEVGRVESIVQKGSHVEVTFTADSDRDLPADVQAVTRSKSILADRSLELVGNYAAGPTLEPGTCIPLENSHTPKSISEVVSSAADFIKALAPEDKQKTIAMAVAGLDESLRGQGESARTMMEHAAEAMDDPDKFVADIGSSIVNMAPLSERALADWAAITSLVQHLPAVTEAGIELWPGVVDVCQGIAWLVRTLEDIQTNYGNDIWPFVHGQVTDAIAMTAGRTGDINSMLGTLPSLEGLVRQQATSASGPHIQYTPPTVAVNDELCAVLDRLRPGSCQRTDTGAHVSATAWMDYTLVNGAAQ
ncbi:MCE family protein [Rhodococcus sp. ZPP]|uniref:MlaD family protein n=1 Tax=Rhodococcus sp. ZPP TaxID=2749906 RepID=UPI001AD8532C|nr:MlaD family protein [Rhodococcus sp. ZPP]QTJ68620.1 MCE family protein [Rhodococcus sp. ZPP]